ncbi:DUF4974 domain-containing protein [Puteibacter caeruleilacunae]|nr:DUF4974 domain-containing protein [Puteibacter caeruleilacunae]
MKSEKIHHPTPEQEQLIARYLNGQCSEAEEKLFKDWIQESELHQKAFFKIKDVWDATIQTENRTDKALLRFYKQKTITDAKKIRQMQVWKWITSAAAIIILGLITTILIPKQQPTYQQITQSVPLGSRSTVTLADGSKVVLNSGSTISYPAVFNPLQREVNLSGEAFFQVQADKSYPFVVKTKDYDVEVTGTSFNVCAYNDNDFSSVVLSEGKVHIAFPKGNNKYELNPGEKFNIDLQSNKAAIKKIDPKSEIAWKDGIFRFKEIKFPQLIKRLERWYDVKLNYSAPELETLLYSGLFKNQETIWQVLDGLKLTSPIDYQRVNFREFNIIYKPMK